MRSKRAWIAIHNADGSREVSREVKLWRTYNITEGSNIIGNLRSRPQFRAGAWEPAGIARLDVTVHKPPGR